MLTKTPTRRLSNIIFSFFIIFSIHYSHAETQAPWELKKDQNGIKVFTRFLEGSGTIEFKAITTLSSRPEKILAVITNTEELHTWLPNFKEAKVLQKENESSWYEYSVLEVPWPLENRDLVLLKKVVKPNADSTSTFVHIVSTPDKHPQQNKLIRINKAKGFWELAPQADNKVQLTYQFYANPELKMPAWLLNMFTVDGPYKSLQHLKKLDTKNPWASRDIIKAYWLHWTAQQHNAPRPIFYCGYVVAARPQVQIHTQAQTQAQIQIQFNHQNSIVWAVHHGGFEFMCRAKQ